jgi:hypothetical protein
LSSACFEHAYIGAPVLQHGPSLAHRWACARMNP